MRRLGELGWLIVAASCVLLAGIIVAVAAGSGPRYSDDAAYSLADRAVLVEITEAPMPVSTSHAVEFSASPSSAVDSYPEQVVSWVQIGSIRTDPDGSGLVANFIGGACEHDERLEVVESADRIEVRATATADVMPVDSAWAAIGVSYTVRARLAAPLGDRTIWSDGRQQLPFDGARLLVPATLPIGFAQTAETSGDTWSVQNPAPGTVTWTRWYAAPEPTPAPGQICTPGRGSLGISQGPAGSVADGWDDLGARTVGSLTVHLLESNAGGGVLSRALLWDAAGGTVMLASKTGCDQDRVLTADDCPQWLWVCGPAPEFRARG